MADFQDAQRLNDKLRNAYGIDIFASAADSYKTSGLSLVGVDNPTLAATPTYDVQKQYPITKYLPLLLLGGLILFAVFRR